MANGLIAYTTYSEAGGVGKTTIAANLAAAHARDGQNVLAVDMDPQDGSLSYLLDCADERADAEADNLVRHLVDRPQGSFEDLVRTVEHGIDVLPSHDMYERLTEILLRAERQAEDLAEDYDRMRQLHRVLLEAGVADAYDILIVDPPATAGPHLYNAIYATRNLVIPVELSGKGEQSVEGLSALVDAIEGELDVTVGVLAVVPNAVKGTADQESYREEIEALGFDVPVVVRDRTSLMQGCWDRQCTAYTYVEEHRSRQRDYELETLDQFDQLADFITRQVRGEVVA